MDIPKKDTHHAWDELWENGWHDTDHQVDAMLYEAACEGDTDAMVIIGCYNRSYWCLPSQTPLYWFRTAAEAGNPKGVYCYAKEILLNKPYCSVNGIENVICEATACLRRAAQEGITSAAFCLYYISLLGLWSTEKDKQAAAHWLKLAKNNRATYEQQKDESGSKNCGNDGWDHIFHKDTTFLLSEDDLQKWSQYVHNK